MTGTGAARMAGQLESSLTPELPLTPPPSALRLDRSPVSSRQGSPHSLCFPSQPGAAHNTLPSRHRTAPSALRLDRSTLSSRRRCPGSRHRHSAGCGHGAAWGVPTRPTAARSGWSRVTRRACVGLRPPLNRADNCRGAVRPMAVFRALWRRGPRQRRRRAEGVPVPSTGSPRDEAPIGGDAGYGGIGRSLISTVVVPGGRSSFTSCGK